MGTENKRIKGQQEDVGRDAGERKQILTAAEEGRQSSDDSTSADITADLRSFARTGRVSTYNTHRVEGGDGAIILLVDFPNAIILVGGDKVMGRAATEGD